MQTFLTAGDCEGLSALWYKKEQIDQIIQIYLGCRHNLPKWLGPSDRGKWLERGKSKRGFLQGRAGSS